MPSEGESVKKIVAFIEHQQLKIRQVVSICAEMHLTAIGVCQITGVAVLIQGANIFCIF